MLKYSPNPPFEGRGDNGLRGGRGCFKNGMSGWIGWLLKSFPHWAILWLLGEVENTILCLQNNCSVAFSENIHSLWAANPLPLSIKIWELMMWISTGKLWHYTMLTPIPPLIPKLGIWITRQTDGRILTFPNSKENNWTRVLTIMHTVERTLCSIQDNERGSIFRESYDAGTPIKNRNWNFNSPWMCHKGAQILARIRMKVKGNDCDLPVTLLEMHIRDFN